MIFDRILSDDHTVHWTAWALLAFTLLIFCSPTEYILKQMFSYSGEMSNALKNTVSFEDARKLFSNHDYSMLNPVDKMRRNILVFKHDQIFAMQENLETLNQKLLQAHTEWAQQLRKGATNPWMGPNQDAGEPSVNPINRGQEEFYTDNPGSKEDNRLHDDRFGNQPVEIDRRFMDSDADFKGVPPPISSGRVLYQDGTANQHYPSTQPRVLNLGGTSENIPYQNIYRDNQDTHPLGTRQPLTVHDIQPHRVPGTQIEVPQPMSVIPPGRTSRSASPIPRQNRPGSPNR